MAFSASLPLFLVASLTPMFWKQSQEAIVVSRDGEQELFRFGAKELAQIAYASAWPGSDELLLTAARTEQDCADVMGNSKGNYRAYAASARGLQLLTKEYTNTAIPLPQGRGLAYCNGGSLVIVRDGQRTALKLGRFSWGPSSLSCTASGERVAMTKWKGDDRKLAFVELTSQALTLSRFSYHSYVLVGDDILYVLGGDVMCYSHATGKSRSITPEAFLPRLLETLGIDPARRPGLVFRFNDLTLLEERPIVVASVQVPGTWEYLWHGIVALPWQDHPLQVVLPATRPWGVGAIAPAGDTLAVTLQRSEKGALVEQRLETVGPRQAILADGWWPIPSPRIPSHGFQFLPT